MNLRPRGPEPVTGTVHAVAGDGRPSQALDATRVETEQVAADLRRTEFLRPEGLLPVAAVAKRLGISAATVHAEINAGKLRAVLFGSVRRVRPEDLEAYEQTLNASRPPADEDWCTVADLARAAGWSRAHAYRLLASGHVPFAVFGRTRYIRKLDLERLLREVAERHGVQGSLAQTRSASPASARLLALFLSRRTAPRR